MQCSVLNIRLIRLLQAYSYAQEMRCDLFAECSAVSGELMQQSFEDIVRVAAKTTTEEGGQSSGSPCVVM